MTPGTSDRPLPGARRALLQDGRELHEQIRALRRYALALVGNAADADDLVQETLKRALTYCDGGKEIRNVKSYLLTILHHARIDHFKRAAKQGETVDIADTKLVADQPGQLSHLNCLDIAEAINQLADEHRSVVLLIGLEGLSYKDTGQILDIPIGTVMSRLSRARATLRKILRIDDDRPPASTAAR